MTDVHQQVDHLKAQIDSGAEETKLYLDKLKKKVEEYDQKHHLSEAASSFLQSGIDTTQSSVDELKHAASALEAKSQSVSDETIATAQRSLHRVKDALDGLQHVARDYDRKFAGSAGASMASGIEDVVNATRQKTTDAVEMACEQATRVREMLQNAAAGALHGAKVTTGEAVKAAEKVDASLGVTPKVSSTVGGVKETVKSLDKRMHVTETAAKLDEKVTGGMAARVVHKGVEMVQESIEYVTETLQQAKLAASKSPTAQHAEQTVSGASDKVSSAAGDVGETAQGAKERVQQSAEQAQDKTMDVTASAKESATGAAGLSAPKSESMTGQAQEMAGQAKDKAQEKGSQMKGGAEEMAGSAEEKGSQAVEGAQGMAGSAKEKGSQALEGAKHKGSDVVEGAKHKGSQAVEETKEKGCPVKEGAQGMVGSSSSSSSSSQEKGTMQSMKERAGDVGTAAKEATMGMSSGDSATDERRTQQQRSSSSGEQDQSATQEIAGRALKTANSAKEKMADTMSRSKDVMKDTTKA
ncbi:hypothetical protein P43SY_006005 [Pythium insidiosum]|uniref:Uncharacterized protein n=1 Tax=Pythium insidiosum TaxID=114742 RepID=A0AAD5LHU6_PYTIN|nr:hypothetical protein P43SY_006005 [Pythium insidiosum]